MSNAMLSTFATSSQLVFIIVLAAHEELTCWPTPVEMIVFQ